MKLGLLFSPLRRQKMLKATFEEGIVGYNETLNKIRKVGVSVGCGCGTGCEHGVENMHLQQREIVPDRSDHELQHNIST